MSLKKNRIYVHEKTQKRYLLISDNMRFKDSDGNWVDGCLYTPLYENTYDYFTRSRESFEKSFTCLEN